MNKKVQAPTKLQQRLVVQEHNAITAVCSNEEDCQENLLKLNISKIVNPLSPFLTQQINNT
jgi:hypothetical protein